MYRCDLNYFPLKQQHQQQQQLLKQQPTARVTAANILKRYLYGSVYQYFSLTATTTTTTTITTANNIINNKSHINIFSDKCECVQLKKMFFKAATSSTTTTYNAQPTTRVTAANIF